LIRLLGSLLIMACAAEASTFCVMYHLSARWWTSRQGRHVMAFTAELAVLLDLWSAGILAGADAPWFQVVRLIAFLGLPFVLGWQLLLLYKIQIRPRRRRDR
jgi:hypothetical protein